MSWDKFFTFAYKNRLWSRHVVPLRELLNGSCDFVLARNDVHLAASSGVEVGLHRS